MSHHTKEENTASLRIDRDRFLEYTSESVSDQLTSLSIEAIECVRSWPCLLMNEGRSQEAAHVAEIYHIRVSGSEVILDFTLLEGAPSITNDAILRCRVELDVQKFEFTRTHWAIKDRDLFVGLAAAGFQFDESDKSQFTDRSLPAPSRPRLLEARTLIAGWGHTEIDDLLLEAGMPGLEAGRELGSRRDRANSILGFALENPAATTAENSLFSAFLVRASGADTTSDDEEIRSPPRASSHDLAQARSATSDAPRSPNRVFVVHGQDEESRAAVVEFLSEVGLEAIVLHQQPNMGRHLLTKFIDEAALVTFAVVLMTGDDEGGRVGSDLAPRARQNVILELGYFLAHLGQPRVCALITPRLETPSDFDGIVYITMEPDGRWKRELRRELAAAEMPLPDL